MSKYLATFDRISRDHDVPPLEVCGVDADELALGVYDYARRRCLSRDIEVVVNLTELRGTIYAGMHTAGSFVLAPL